MSESACLYVALPCARALHERVLREAIGPLARTLATSPALDSLFFVRYDTPDWQLRLRVLGPAAWLEEHVRPRLLAALAPLQDDGTLAEPHFGEYQREYERYGGALGMRLAERLFLHDSLAALELIEADARGALSGSRREYSLLLTERLLDLMTCDARQRLEVYDFAQRFAFEQQVLHVDDRPRLDAQYARLRDGLRARILDTRDAVERWGGAEPARIAAGWARASQPILAELCSAVSEGRVSQNLTSLAWSYAHMQCNRLGVELVPEALLRYFLYRFWSESLDG